MATLATEWQAWLKRRIGAAPRATEPPLRAELLSGEHLERHARALATQHRAVTRKHPNRLLADLTENERNLRAFNRATLAVTPARRITPAAEWLLDNFYLIEEQIQMARRHLPRGYSRELPCLSGGGSAGLPRIYDLVLELISHVDAQVDAGPLLAFVAAYQTVTPLKLGELWAIPIMLRLGLIENLERVTRRLVIAREDRDAADLCADRLQAMAEEDPSRVIVVVADMADADLPVSSSFVAEFCQRLSRLSPELHIARTWLDQRLAGLGLSLDQLVHQESQSQAADQVSVSHSIASLRSLGATDWKGFVETLSVVEAALRDDPAGVYATMDFATRDRYRHAVESVARHSGVAEAEVARLAVELAAEEARARGGTDRRAHVGYHLIDRGLDRLAERTRVRWPVRDRAERAVRRFPLACYAGGIAAVTLLAGAGALAAARAQGVAGGVLAGLAPAVLLGASQLAVALVNRVIALLVRPRLLPRLDFSDGIAPGCRTVVVVPTMLAGAESIDRLLETMEIHALANRDPLLQFALLTDLPDAEAETLPGDEALVGRARAGVERLNARYPAAQGGHFFLFHRPRRWNEAERRWMGYERKRGKLEEFNAFLRDGAQGSFATIAGDLAGLAGVSYVITLDSDTELPRDAARSLIGTMAHPLNRPVFDEARGIVREGYGILQPRVGVSLPGARRSWFVRLMAGDAGIDPYTQEVSDVYQDLFGEGSFIGKGIYDVDAFRRALAGRCPENAVLSHDLLEACHARSALVSDVEFYEEHPSRHDVDSGRRHRWIRGDWQITPWLLPRVPGPDARWTANPLSALSRWKIFDNLRRSLVPVALLALLVGGWLLVPELGGAATGLVLGMIALPGVLAAVLEAGSRPAELPWLVHWRSVAATASRHLGQLLLTLAFLPYDAFVSLDAIGRTLLRLGITRRRLLEWQTSSDREQTPRSGLGDFYRTMWSSPAVGLAAGGALALFQPEQVLQAWPLLGLWLAAPGIAWRISQPILAEAPDLSAPELRFLRTVARKTWSFFERFVTAEENWLPPDNFQETPVPTIASRTSPTNLGLALLANLAARDLGYLSLGGLVRRTQATLGTMQRLGRFRGHFFNWYDTRTLQPLPPLYVSSVDSGNLAGHLLTLAAGLREQAAETVDPARACAGLGDTLDVLRDLLPGHAAAGELDALAAVLTEAPAGLRAGHAVLVEAAARAGAIERRLAGEAAEIRRWAEHLRRDAEEHLYEVRAAAPWLRRGDTAAAAPAGARAELDERGPTWAELAVYDDADTAAGARAADGRAAAVHARARLAELETLARQCEALAAMDFQFLFDAKRDLFCTGFNVADRRFDGGFYDLLASEARLGSYVAIALGQVPQDHWFSLGRLLAAPNGDPVLISWSGSMFEYLMPLLVMPSYENTLLDRTCRAAVRQQIEYGRRCGVPWGISESGYNRTDVHLNYQYRAFGVPGLGLKRGLAGDLVIAPYAAAMALMVAPREACENLRRLARDGRAGAHGFYEAVDYTPGRLPPGETSTTIRSFMAHHQGMSLLALANFLQGNPMPRRFAASPVLRTADLLLQERVPKAAARVLEDDLEMETGRTGGEGGEGAPRVFTTPAPASPEVHLLSNGRYHVAITSAGGGYSRWRDLAVTRWREDGTRDCWGTFVYLRDAAGGDFWSAAHQPTLRPTRAFEAIFTPSRAEFRHRLAGLEVHTEVAVSPEDDVELRRITVTNRTADARVIELTSYAEVVLAPPAADASHPAFGNLFVQTEFVPESAALLCTRRARSAEEVPPWLLHLAPGQGGAQGAVSCETDRARFIGRGGTPANPAAMRQGGPLSNTVGSVLDPIVALRRTVALAAHETAVVVFVVGATSSRDGALALVHKYQDARMAERVFDLAWTHCQVELRHLNASEADAQLYARLAGALIYADPVRRAEAGVLRGNRRGQSALWPHGVSGDVPLVLLRAGDPQKIELVRQLIQAHAYWRTKGLAVELVILSDDISVYRQSLHDQIAGMVATGLGAQVQDRPGGIFVRRFEQVSGEDRTLLQAVARIVLDDARGSLAEQLERRGALEPVIPLLVPSRTPATEAASAPAPVDLIFRNGLGGFARDGREYVIVLEPGQTTPAPWVNVIANPAFGTVVSESGSAYTWAENAHEFRLTPWSNDPVQDPAGEAFYLRDEQTGQVWSPTPGPARGATAYVIRHGFGYSVFSHTEHGIASEVRVFVARDAAVKFTTVTLRNVSGRARRLSVTGYWEWVLGDVRAKTLLHVQTEIDTPTGALLAANPYNAEFAGRIAFVDAGEGVRLVTGDRKEFLGRNGGPEQPAALKRARLSGKVGAGLDACGAVQIAVDLSAGEERELVFRLGVGRSPAEVQELIQRFRRPDAVRAELESVRAHWERTLGTVAVETPDPAVNVMANGWLLYQTLGARIWGRTGFYQSGGAYGFRDQLQDVMALMHAAPAVAREQLVRAAGRQFREGDVQHWWHPPSGRGVRTHCSDDFLWLPYATCRYVACTGDTGVLDETAGFLDGRAVKVDEEAYYDLPNRTEGTATLYDHCVLAIGRGLAVGAHGLPLIGCGDWNDGMNAVGRDGRGESVWLAFFLTDVLTRFAGVARRRGDAAFADRCVAHAERLRTSIEQHGWDGEWYRRAYFDDGTPLGSALNPECQIDSLPQSWAVISGAGDPARARQAMDAVERRLVRRAAGLVQLFDPPFDRSALDPGYIKGYIPGVRENGGQYTHGAVWAAMAFALMGDTDRAWALFNLLNPVRHGDSPAHIAVYKVEPYVVAADVYAVAPHVGRGGWTWYTGSAGWMYRLLVETLLGVNREGDRLRLAPRMPKTWRSYRVRYRHGRTLYRITFTAVAADAGATDLVALDGRAIAGTTVPLCDDGAEHTVEMNVPAGWIP